MSPWHLVQPWFEINLPDGLRRNPRTLVEALAPEKSPRYAVRDTTGDGRVDTFCNVFSSDYTRNAGVARAAFVPQRVNNQGAPARGIGTVELNANDMIRWVAKRWIECDLDTANKYVQGGHVVLVTFHNPKGIGHIAPMVDVATIANVGRTNFSFGSIERGFGKNPVKLYASQKKAFTDL